MAAVLKPDCRIPSVLHTASATLCLSAQVEQASPYFRSCLHIEQICLVEWRPCVALPTPNMRRRSRVLSDGDFSLSGLWNKSNDLGKFPKDFNEEDCIIVLVKDAEAPKSLASRAMADFDLVMSGETLLGRVWAPPRSDRLFAIGSALDSAGGSTTLFAPDGNAGG